MLVADLRSIFSLDESRAHKQTEDAEKSVWPNKPESTESMLSLKDFSSSHSNQLEGHTIN